MASRKCFLLVVKKEMLKMREVLFQDYLESLEPYLLFISFQTVVTIEGLGKSIVELQFGSGK